MQLVDSVCIACATFSACSTPLLFLCWHRRCGIMRARSQTCGRLGPPPRAPRMRTLVSIHQK